jgi:DNA-binding response OmpR family regulator
MLLTKGTSTRRLDAVSGTGKAKILIADDQEALRSLLSRMLSREGFEPIEADDGEKAIELYRSLAPPLVISDIMMPKKDGLTLLTEIKKIDPTAAVILMTGHGNEDILLKALQGGATNFFKKPFNVRGLIREIHKIFQYKAVEAKSSLYSPFLIRESKEFAIRTGNPQYQPVVNQITLQLPCLLPESEILNLKIGIEEMLTNAIEHGNLGISFHEKKTAIEKGKLGELLAGRLEEGGNADKKVIVKSTLTPEAFSISIKDEGAGFDWRNLPELLPENLFSYNGRGIFLTKIYYDEVYYSQSGNEVTLVKRKKDGGAPPHP